MISKLPRSTTFETSMILNCTWNWVFQDNNQVRRGILEQFAQCIWKSLLRVTSSYPRINNKQWCFYARTETTVYWLLQDHLILFSLLSSSKLLSSSDFLAWTWPEGTLDSGFLEGVILSFKFLNSSFFLLGKFPTLFTCNREGSPFPLTSFNNSSIWSKLNSHDQISFFCLWNKSEMHLSSLRIWPSGTRSLGLRHLNIVFK